MGFRIFSKFWLAQKRTTKKSKKIDWQETQTEKNWRGKMGKK